MSNSKFSGRLLRSTLLAGAAAIATPAFAQDDVTPLTGADSIDEIVVTGSRLNQANLRGPSPVTSIGGEEIDIRGATNVVELVNVLPQAFAAQTSDVANGATGTSTLNLRGLGAVRTLTLIDGRRLPFGSASSSAVNVDMVPAQLVERIDITTGGESAVYGSDAVAGVANFILRRDFEGFEFDIQGGFFLDDNDNDFAQSVLNASNNDPVSGTAADGEEINVSAIFGANLDDGRGNVTAFASFARQTAILQGDRDISGCALGSASGATSFEGVGCVGSTTFRRFFSAEDTFLSEDGTLVDFVGGPAQTFNFGPTNFFRRPVDRFNFQTLARYEINDNIEAFADIGFMHSNTDAQIAFSGSFFRPFTVNCANPFLGNGLGPNGDGVGTFGDLTGCDGATGTLTGQQVLDGDPSADRLSLTSLRNQLAALDLDAIDPDDPEDAILLEQMRLEGLAAPLEGLLINEDGSLPDNVPFSFGYRNVEGDPRNSEIENQTFRLVGGFRGEVEDAFDWEVFGQYSRTRTNDISTGDLSFANVQDALNVQLDDDGNAVCVSGNAGCVPYNVFGRSADGGSLVTPEATAFIQGNGFTTGTTEQFVAGGFVRSDLTERGFVSPLASTGIQGLVGIEYREDTLDRNPDDVSQIPGGRGLTGVGGGTLAIDGSIEVFELYGEVSIPLIEDAPFAEQLVLDAAYRYSDYTNEGSNPTDPTTRTESSFDADTYRVGLRYVPNSELTLRGQYQRAVRAPNVFDLFIGQNTGLFDLSVGPNGLFDPCASGTDGDGNPIAPAASAAACANTGVTAAQFGNIPDNAAGQFNNVTGGNASLTPEVADTFTLGVVWEPEAVAGLSVSVDYFDIEIADAIGTVPALTSLTQCLETGNPAFCDLIQRDQFGSLFLDNSNFEGVQQTNQNIAEIATSGFDLAVRYDYDLGEAGSLDFNYAATILDNYEFTPAPGEDAVSCERKFAGQCDEPRSEYIHRFLASYRTPIDLDLTATWRYNTAVDLQGGGAGNELDEELEDRHYFDLAALYDLNETVTLRAGVNNLFDRDPPISTSVGNAPGNGNTFPGFYNATGRFLFAGANFTF